MEKKLQIIETSEYILAVSDEEIKVGDFCIMLDSAGNLFSTIQQYTNPKTQHLNDGLRKVIAYLPKGNAPELDLPLLPKMVDDVEKSASYYYGEHRRTREFEEGFRKGFEICYNLTPKYSEEDLRKAIRYGFDVGFCSNSSNKIKNNLQSEEEFIKSLKQPETPKWFVPRIERYDFDEEWSDLSGAYETYKERFETTTNSQGKKLLVGTYLFE